MDGPECNGSASAVGVGVGVGFGVGATGEGRRRSLEVLYRSRLRLAPDAPLPPTLGTLKLLTEAHLRHIPFENVSMHARRRRGDGTKADDGNERDVRDEEEKKADEERPGEDGAVDAEDVEPPIVLDAHRLVGKILVRNRGGCCLDLNGLYAEFLRSLGYAVRLVPCWVHAGRERGHAGGRAKFRAVQTHFWLLVGGVLRGDGDGDGEGGVETGRNGDREGEGRQYLVDVGLGEPPLGPLAYGPGCLGAEQRTPDGMRSRIVREGREWTDGRGRVRRCLRLEWRRWRHGGAEDGDGRGGSDSDGAASSASARGDEERRLRAEADRLRSVADRARRKSLKVRPKMAIQAFKADRTVREEAVRRLRRHGGRESGDVHPSAAEVHREVSSMWSSASEDERRSYAERGRGEADELCAVAKRAEEAARAAERAASEAEMGDAAVRSEDLNNSGGAATEGSDVDSDGSYWEPRLQWDISDAPLSPTALFHEQTECEGPALGSFHRAAAIIASDRSTFAKKVIACHLTRDAKVTLSGRTLRVTSPRFIDLEGGTDGGNAPPGPKQTVIELGGEEDVRAALEERFGVPRDETEGLDLRASDAGANSRLWDHL